MGGVAIGRAGLQGVGYTDTPLIPDQKWKVHDSARPNPPIITPGTYSTDAEPGRPPSDAVVLFDGKDLSKWNGPGGKAPGWKVENGYFQIVGGTGSISTKDKLGSVHLHIEWSAPNPPKGSSQGRGNSGVMFFGRYEVQVLDSYENKTYADGQAGSIYGTYPPLVNAMKRPGEWNVYDIFFEAPSFENGRLARPAYITVMHNGVLLHHYAEIKGDSLHRAAARYVPHEPTGSLVLQDHGDPVRYRNIWYRPIKSYDEP